MRSILLACILVVFPSLSFANCLREVASFASEVCGAIENSSSSQKLDTSGRINVEAQGIIRRFLGEASGEIDVKYLESSATGVLQRELGADRIDVRRCRENMVAAARQEACVVYSVCRRPEFGLDRYANVQEHTGSSGWRGGGYNPDAYCSDFTRATVSALGIGDKDFNSRVIRKGENARWVVQGLNLRKRQYNYHCTVEISWNPVYIARRDPGCGRE